MTRFKTFADREKAENEFCEKHGVETLDGTSKSVDNWEDTINSMGEENHVVLTFLGNDHGCPWFALSFKKLNKRVQKRLFAIITAEVEENN